MRCELLNDTFIDERHLWHLGETFARLQANLDAPVTKTLFERTLRFAFQDAGAAVSMPSDRNHAGHDITIDGVRISVKTEAERAMGRDTMRISKLMEAVWSKNFTSTDDVAAAVARVLEHLAGYERIIMLRVFHRPDVFEYELIEIPRALLMRIGELRAEDFTPLTANGSTRAIIRPSANATRSRGADVQFRLIFDGSDNKVTIKSLRTELCITHARWVIARDIHAAGARGGCEQRQAGGQVRTGAQGVEGPRSTD